MSSQCVDLLEENGSWEKPYVYKKPESCRVVDKPPPNEGIESQCNDHEHHDSFRITAEFDSHTEEQPDR